jgi:hypothetical protein
MKRLIPDLIFIIAFISALSFASCNTSSSGEPWKETQLLEPAALAATINDSATTKPVILCIGPGAAIKGSIEIGPAGEAEHLEQLKSYLNTLPKDTPVVVYCGCCPFANCPNIRPAFKLLNEKQFTQTKLLNLEHNLRTDWIDKGYPR